jgi:phage gp36-like protein
MLTAILESLVCGTTKGVHMEDMVKYIKMTTKETEDIIDKYKDAVCWLAFSALLNVVLISTLFLA